MTKEKIDYRQIAAEIFLKQQEKQDSTLFLLETLAILDFTILPDIIKAYKQIANGELKIVQISFAHELSVVEKKNITQHIIKKFGEEVVFIYKEDLRLVEGIRVQVGDMLYDLSIKSLA